MSKKSKKSKKSKGTIQVKDYGYIKQPEIPVVDFPTVSITRGAYEQFEHLCKGHRGNEVAWYGCAELDKEANHFSIHGEMWIPEQDVKLAHTESSAADEDIMLSDMMDEEPWVMNQLLVHVHTHVRMEAFASGTDDEQAIRFMNEYGNHHEFIIKIVVNAKMDTFVQVLHTSTGLARKTNLTIEPVCNPEVLARIGKQVSERCRVPKTLSAPPNIRGKRVPTGYSSYGSNRTGGDSYMRSSSSPTNHRIGGIVGMGRIDDTNDYGDYGIDSPVLESMIVTPDHLKALTPKGMAAIISANPIRDIVTNRVYSFSSSPDDTVKATEVSDRPFTLTRNFISAGKSIITEEEMITYGGMLGAQTVIFSFARGGLMYEATTSGTHYRVSGASLVDGSPFSPFIETAMIYGADYPDTKVTGWLADRLMTQLTVGGGMYAGIVYDAMDCDNFTIETVTEFADFDELSLDMVDIQKVGTHSTAYKNAFDIK